MLQNRALSRRRLIATLAAALIVGIVGYLVGVERGREAVLENPPPIARPVVIDDMPSGRVIAEFERQDALLVGFNELIEYHPETLVSIVREVESRIRVIGLVRNMEQQQQVDDLLAEQDVNRANVEYFVWPTDRMWVQDFGPLFLVNGSATIVDFNYHHPNSDYENLLPLAFAAQYGFRINHSHLNFDGGNLLTNGMGLAISTTSIVNDNAERQFKLTDIGAHLNKYLHFEAWSYLTPLEGEPTGHVDIFATFVAPDVVVVGSYKVSDDPVNASILDRNALELGDIETQTGLLQVKRIQNPHHHDGKWRTYTNVVYANGVLLVPQYPEISPDLDRAALALYRELMPDWNVVGIDVSKIVAKGGALHCIALNIPRLPKRPAAL